MNPTTLNFPTSADAAETARALLTTRPARAGAPPSQAEGRDLEAAGEPDTSMKTNPEVGFRSPTGSLDLLTLNHEGRTYTILEAVIWRIKLPTKAVKADIAAETEKELAAINAETPDEPPLTRLSRSERIAIRDRVATRHAFRATPVPSGAQLLISADRLILIGASKADAPHLVGAVTACREGVVGVLPDHDETNTMPEGFWAWLQTTAEAETHLTLDVVGPIVGRDFTIENSAAEAQDVDDDGEEAQEQGRGRSKVKVGGAEAAAFIEKHKLRDPQTEGFTFEVRDRVAVEAALAGEGKYPTPTLWSAKRNQWGAVKATPASAKVIEATKEELNGSKDLAKTWLAAKAALAVVDLRADMLKAFRA